MSEDYYMCCGVCGYETEKETTPFHRMDVNELSQEGERIFIDICDICHNINGAYSQYHSRVDIPITYLTFVQGLHYINESIKEGR